MKHSSAPHFTVTRRGYKPDEVEAALDELVDTLADAEQRNRKLARLIQQKDEELADCRAQVGALQTRLDLLAADNPQALPPSTRMTRMLSFAQAEADEIIASARDEAIRIQSLARTETVDDPIDTQAHAPAVAPSTSDTSATDNGAPDQRSTPQVLHAALVVAEETVLRARVDAAALVRTAKLQAQHLIDAARDDMEKERAVVVEAQGKLAADQATIERHIDYLVNKAHEVARLLTELRRPRNGHPDAAARAEIHESASRKPAITA